MHLMIGRTYLREMPQGSEKDTRPTVRPYPKYRPELQELHGSFACHCRIARQGEDDQ
jgi:hypothetical protein